MKWYKKIGIGLGIALLAYLIGNWIPIELLKPNIVKADIKTADFYRIVLSSISAIVTFLAVFVALFKDDIRKYWNYSKIEIRNPSENIKERTSTSSDSQSDSSEKHIEAKKYESSIEIHNVGNISAIGAELYLEKLTFEGTGYTSIQNIETSGVPLYWSGSEKSTIIIPPEGRKLVKIVELNCPEKHSLPTGDKSTIPAKLQIGNIENNPEFKNGKWVGTFVLYSQNAKPLRFSVNIDWNGRWEKRLAEMKKYLKIDINNK